MKKNKIFYMKTEKSVKIIEYLNVWKLNFSKVKVSKIV